MILVGNGSRVDFRTRLMLVSDINLSFIFNVGFGRLNTNFVIILEHTSLKLAVQLT